VKIHYLTEKEVAQRIIGKQELGLEELISSASGYNGLLHNHTGDFAPEFHYPH
jgi:hypothetical protein